MADIDRCAKRPSHRVEYSRKGLSVAGHDGFETLQLQERAVGMWTISARRSPRPAAARVAGNAHLAHRRIGLQPRPCSDCRKSLELFFDRRRAVGMKRLDRLQPPRLSLLALFLGPDDRLPVRREDEASAGIGDLDPIAAGLVDVEKERLLDGMLVRPGLDEDTVLQEDVGGAQHVLAAVERVSRVMEAAGGIGAIV